MAALSFECIIGEIPIFIYCIFAAKITADRPQNSHQVRIFADGSGHSSHFADTHCQLRYNNSVAP